MAAYGDVDVCAEVLSSLLLAVSTALADAGRPVGRICRSPGPPSSDCESLTAWSSHTVLPTKAGPGTRGVVRHVADVSVRLLRCVTLVEHGIPSEEQVDADGAAYAIDQWIVARAIGVWPGVYGCSRLQFSGITADQLSTLSSMTARVQAELATVE